jgi:hypothetical protein
MHFQNQIKVVMPDYSKCSGEKHVMYAQVKYGCESNLFDGDCKTYCELPITKRGEETLIAINFENTNETVQKIEIMTIDGENEVFRSYINSLYIRPTIVSNRFAFFDFLKFTSGGLQDSESVEIRIVLPKVKSIKVSEVKIYFCKFR